MAETVAETIAEVTEETVPETTAETASLCAHDRAEDCAVCALEAKIEALPTAEDWLALDQDAQLEVYNEAQAITDQYDALTEADQALVANLDKLIALHNAFNAQTEATASFVAEGRCGENLTWTVDEDGVLTISGDGPMYENLYAHFDDIWHGWEYPITSVVFKGNITSIGEMGFSNLPDLTSITIPASVETIGDFAFEFSYNLQKILVSVNNPNYAGSNGLLLNKAKDTLIYCPAGKTGVIEIPSTVTTLAAYSIIFDIPTPPTIKIPASVNDIDPKAFYRSRVKINVDEANQTYASINGMLFNKAKTELLHCGLSGAVTIPNGTVTIGDLAFYDSQISSVTIPNTVKSIGYCAFFLCDKLTSVTIPASVTNIEWEVFALCTSLKSITVASGNTAFASKNGALYNKNMTELIQWPGADEGIANIPSTVTSIRLGAFQGSYISGVNFPAGITSIPDMTFEECPNLKEITIPASIKSIEDYAFGNCDTYSDSGRNPSQLALKFLGNAPTFSEDTFQNTTATVYYPSGNSTWTSDVRQNYGGTITWKSYTPSTTAPAAPTLKAYPKTTSPQPKLTWNKVSGAAKYTIYRAPKGSTSYTELDTVTTLFYTDATAVPGQTYNYKVRAVSSNGTVGKFSNVKAVTCFPSQPTLTSHTVASGKPYLTWNASKGATGYLVYYRVKGTDTFKKLIQKTGTSVLHTGAAAGKTYEYYVKAYVKNADGTFVYSQDSAILSVAAKTVTPTLKSRSIASGKPSMTWNAVNGADGYLVYYRVKGGTYKILKQKADTFINHTGAASGKTYQYYVKAFTKVDGKFVYSAPSNVISITSK